MNDLLQRRCQPVSGAPMSELEVRAFLQQAAGWSLHDGAIEKCFRFGDFHKTMAFVNAVAHVAHAEDHHPDLAVSYDRCTVRYSTHSVGGLSINDFICAAKIDALPEVAG